MTSFIIISPDKIRRQEYIRKFCLEQKIKPLDITIIEKDTTIKKNAYSIGIEDIKNMHKKLHLKPIKSPVKAVIIEDAQFLTPEGQNALLKVLEEPPANTIIMLSSTTIEAFLPTIISRCKTIELDQIRHNLTAKEIKELIEFINSLPGMSIPQKLRKAEYISKDKEKAVIWVSHLIIVLRDKYLNHYTLESLRIHNTQEAQRNSEKAITNEADITPNTLANFTIDEILSTLKQFQSLHTLLKTTNVNTRFAIEQTLLQLK